MMNIYHIRSLEVSSEQTVIDQAALRSFLRLDSVDAATELLLSNLTKAAIEAIERYTNLSMLPKTLEVTYRGKSASSVELPLGPVTEVLEVTTKNYLGNDQQLPHSTYSCTTNLLSLHHEAYDFLKVVYKAGDASHPLPLHNVAVLEVVGMMYEHGLHVDLSSIFRRCGLARAYRV